MFDKLVTQVKKSAPKVEKCDSCGEVAGEDSHEIKGEVLCLDCYGDVMDDILFG